MFWTDKWLNRQCIADLAPSLFAAISQRRRKQRTVQSALLNQAWIVDIQGSLSVDTITEYIQLWDLLDEVQLQQEVDDTHKWRFDSSRLPMDAGWSTWAVPPDGPPPRKLSVVYGRCVDLLKGANVT
jgi:hypothetical protein